MDIIKKLAQELSLREHQVQQTVTLLDQGNTIPFIARYRKEATGELDEVQIRALSERLAYLRPRSRKAEVLRLIGEQGKLTAEIEQAVRGEFSPGSGRPLPALPAEAENPGFRPRKRASNRWQSRS